MTGVLLCRRKHCICGVQKNSIRLMNFFFLGKGQMKSSTVIRIISDMFVSTKNSTSQKRVSVISLAGLCIILPNAVDF